jgi:anti-sigma regulatory factor (Ser/Thr protein kinase)
MTTSSRVTIARPPALIEPVAAAMLASWATHHRTRKRSLRISGPLQSPIAFRTGLLTALAGRPHKLSAETHLLRPIQMVGEQTMKDTLEPLIEQMQIPDEQTSDAALHILEDLGRNVFHHAKTCGEGAHVAASYNHDDRLLRLGVADCGQGIAADIQTHVSPALSDAEAVEVALEPQISGSAQTGDKPRRRPLRRPPPRASGPRRDVDQDRQDPRRVLRRDNRGLQRFARSNAGRSGAASRSR